MWKRSQKLGQTIFTCQQARVSNYYLVSKQVLDLVKYSWRETEKNNKISQKNHLIQMSLKQIDQSLLRQNFQTDQLFPTFEQMKSYQNIQTKKSIFSINSQNSLMHLQQLKMKKIVIIILATLLILAHGAESDYLPGVGTASPTQIYYNGLLVTTTKCTDYQLNAGNTFLDYGTVRVCNDQFYLYIGVYADEGFSGTEAVKIWVGTSLALLPTSGGRAIAGKFDYKSPYFDTTTYYWSIRIAFSDIKVVSTDPKPSCNAVTIYVYVHVDCAHGNTCWGGTSSACIPSGAGQAWYCSIAYVTQCPGTIENPDCATNPNQAGCPTFTCETAYGYGNYILVNTSNPDNLPIADLTNKAKRWGWAYLSPSTGATATYNIYAGAGLNYISKGYLIGNVTYTWDPILHQATASVSISNNFYVDSYHIHIGDSLPGNVAAPGQYSGCMDSFDYPQSLYSFSCVVDNIVDANSDGIWFITHIGVCKTF